MARLGVRDPGTVAVAGDTVSDLEAGTRAGAGAVVGVLSGAHDEASLIRAPHTAIVPDVTAFVGVLEGRIPDLACPAPSSTPLTCGSRQKMKRVLQLRWRAALAPRCNRLPEQGTRT